MSLDASEVHGPRLPQRDPLTQASRHPCIVEHKEDAVWFLYLIGCVSLSPCAQTCSQLYDADACNLQSPGMTTEELVDHCMDACDEAYRSIGEATEGYEPTEYTPSNESVTLETRGDVALWSDCIDEMTCEDLRSGYCAPVW
jgi:hypothetical protein